MQPDEQLAKKQQLVTELEKYVKLLNLEQFIREPEHETIKNWFAAVAACIKVLDKDGYKTFIDEYQKALPQKEWPLAKRQETAERLVSFIKQKIIDYQRANLLEKEKEMQAYLLQSQKHTEELLKQLNTQTENIQLVKQQKEELLHRLTTDTENIQAKKEEQEKVVRDLQETIQKVQAETNHLRTAKGERGTKHFEKHFAGQSASNETQANKWLLQRQIFFWVIFGLILVHYLLYLFLFFAHKFAGWTAPEEFFSLQYGAVNFTLLALLSSGLAFCSRNYNIHANQMLSNKHRAVVAETLNDFLSTNPTPEDRTTLMKQGTETMFKHLPVGYIPKNEGKDDGPLVSILNSMRR